tara:strand:+ start:51620 stop:51724 length:105 start_codon:yes stop_codon:yes gene_type:complete
MHNKATLLKRFIIEEANMKKPDAISTGLWWPKPN